MLRVTGMKHESQIAYFLSPQTLMVNSLMGMLRKSRGKRAMNGTYTEVNPGKIFCNSTTSPRRLKLEGLWEILPTETDTYTKKSNFNNAV